MNRIVQLCITLLFFHLSLYAYDTRSKVKKTKYELGNPESTATKLEKERKGMQNLVVPVHPFFAENELKEISLQNIQPDKKKAKKLLHERNEDNTQQPKFKRPTLIGGINNLSKDKVEEKEIVYYKNLLEFVSSNDPEKDPFAPVLVELILGEKKHSAPIAEAVFSGDKQNNVVPWFEKSVKKSRDKNLHVMLRNEINDLFILAFIHLHTGLLNTICKLKEEGNLNYSLNENDKKSLFLQISSRVRPANIESQQIKYFLPVVYLYTMLKKLEPVVGNDFFEKYLSYEENNKPEGKSALAYFLDKKDSLGDAYERQLKADIDCLSNLIFMAYINNLISASITYYLPNITFLVNEAKKNKINVETEIKNLKTKLNVRLQNNKRKKNISYLKKLRNKIEKL